MKYNVFVFYLFAANTYVESYTHIKSLEHYISGGSYVKYSQDPHSIYLRITCDHVPFICGGSILNQNIILTAAHCTETCIPGLRIDIKAKYGHEDVKKMTTVNIISFMPHQNYNEVTVENDINMMMTKSPISLNNVIKRVIVMKNPPYSEFGYVSGWGIDERNIAQSKLKHTICKIHSPEECSMAFNDMHPGIFCAGPVTGIGAANRGDSGGALVINNYIQIGIVSYKSPGYSLVAYTNVSHYYNWILKNSKRLYCS